LATISKNFYGKKLKMAFPSYIPNDSQAKIVYLLRYFYCPEKRQIEEASNTNPLLKNNIDGIYRE